MTVMSFVNKSLMSLFSQSFSPASFTSSSVIDNAYASLKINVLILSLKIVMLLLVPVTVLITPLCP